MSVLDYSNTSSQMYLFINNIKYIIIGTRFLPENNRPNDLQEECVAPNSAPR